MKRPPPPPRIGRFRVLGRAGTGGMSEVYRVRDDANSQSTIDLALKVLVPELEAEPSAVRMFVNEAAIGVQVRHPGIVRVLEHGLIDGRHYMLMDLVDGPDLARIQAALHRAGRELGIPLALYITAHALRALDHAHFAVSPSGQPLALLHRDVSPDNLFCTRGGAVLLSDFGVAKVSATEFFTDPRQGIRGKLAFMAPERARGEVHDGRADEFSAALVLYELCTGVRPYKARKGESVVDHVHRVAEAQVPRARTHVPGLPRRLDAALRRALSPDPAERFPTCRAFAVELAGVASDENMLAGPAELAALVAELFPS